MHGLLYEAVAQTHSPPVRMGLCNSIRSLTAGVEPFYPLCEAAQAHELDPEELHHPVMRRLGRLSADAAVWIPDLFSAVKEQEAGEMINLALAYQRAYECSLSQGVTLAIRRINITIDEFETLYAKIKPELSPAGCRIRGRHVRLDSRVLLLVPHRAALRGRDGGAFRQLTADQSSYVT